MNETATLTITSGPDRGKVYQLNDELVHLGRGPQNQVALSDLNVADHQASIVSRDGRYAIFTPVDRSVEVDGAVIPSKRWVWLPTEAKIQVSDHTALQFRCGGESDAESSGSNSLREPSTRQSNSQIRKAKRPRSKSGSSSKAGTESGRQVARFITDRAGDPLVALGEDGQLPELTLTEGPSRKATVKSPQQTSPLVIYGLVALSFCFTLALLLIDIEPSGSLASEHARARREITRFYEPHTGEIEPYQRLLRDAQLAHSRNARKSERIAYQKVLSLLNSEDVSQFTGLTGSPEDDEQLRKLIATLLRR